MRCNKLTRIEFGKSLKELELYNFENCNLLEEIVFKSIPIIYSCAFYNCNNIKRIIFDTDELKKEITLDNNQEFISISVMLDDNSNKRIILYYRDNIKKIEYGITYDDKFNKLNETESLCGIPDGNSRDEIVIRDKYDRIEFSIMSFKLLDLSLVSCNTNINVMNNCEKIILPNITEIKTNNSIKIFTHGSTNKIIIRSNKTNTLDNSDLEISISNVTSIKTIDNYYVINSFLSIGSEEYIFCHIVDEKLNVKIYNCHVNSNKELNDISKLSECSSKYETLKNRYSNIRGNKTLYKAINNVTI